MPRGEKSSHTGKQKKMASHSEKGHEKRGTSKKEAERRAWATVNKQTGGGKKAGGTRKGTKSSTRSASHKGIASTHAKRVAAGRKGGRARAARSRA
jgi:hypothetical protein